jgi:FkbH-like protein
VTLGGYDTIQQDAIALVNRPPSSWPDIVLLSVVLEYLDPGSRARHWDSERARDGIIAVAELVTKQTSCTVVVNTVLAPLDAEDNLCAALRGEHRSTRIQALNDDLRRVARTSRGRIFIADWERVLSQLGQDRALDPRFGYMYRLPVTKDFLAVYARQVATIARLLKGHGKKCLVLDCDNTLWGGIVGEDGRQGIRLDPHAFPGCCYYDFQRSILNLITTGTVVTLCSRNDASAVWDVIDNHPHSLLRREHIAASRINWRDKATNMAELSREIKLHPDSMVFVDDSPSECELIRQSMPEVSVLQVPTRVHELPALLYRTCWFDTLGTSAEDERRTNLYQEASRREAARTEFADLDAYLASLELRGTIQRVSADTLRRSAQLIAKANQFNLTTKRYSEPQLQGLLSDPLWAIFTLSAADRFGDLGIVGVLIAERRADCAWIDSLVLSCRALGRQLEIAFADRCVAALEREWSVSQWRAAYVPSEKNSMAESFWKSVGFHVLTGEGTNGTVIFGVESASRSRPPTKFIRLLGI